MKKIIFLLKLEKYKFKTNKLNEKNDNEKDNYNLNK